MTLIANVTVKIFDNNILNYKLMHSINETLLYSSWTCGHCMLEVIYILVEAIVAIRDFYTISMTWVLWYIFNELRVWNVTSFVLQIHTCLECIILMENDEIAFIHKIVSIVRPRRLEKVILMKTGSW